MSEKIGAAPTGRPDDSAARRTHWRGAATPAEEGELRQELQLAMQEASAIAESLFRQHFSADEDYTSGRSVWGLCDSLRGVLSQIDNMTVGLCRRVSEPLQVETIGENSSFEAADKPLADALDAERWGSEPVTGTPFLQEGDQHLLDRFIETTEDNEGFDIGKEAIKRLAHLGVVESLGFGRYGVTMFGYWVHEHYWHQNPSLPLKTNADRDADARAAIAAAKGGNNE